MELGVKSFPDDANAAFADLLGQSVVKEVLSRLDGHFAFSQLNRSAEYIPGMRTLRGTTQILRVGAVGALVVKALRLLELARPRPREAD